MPERFEPLGTTVDPVARSMRALDGATPEQEAERLADLPQGFWDPQVAGEGEDGLPRPLRTLEMDCFLSDRPLRQDKAAQMWFRMRRILPETLAEFGLPGYALVDQYDTALGPVAALGFEFRWDGVQAASAGRGPRARRVGADGDPGVPAVLPLPRGGVGRPAARARWGSSGRSNRWADPGEME